MSGPKEQIILDKSKAFKFELDDEEAQEQVIRDAKKYGMAVLKAWILSANWREAPTAGENKEDEHA